MYVRIPDGNRSVWAALVLLLLTPAVASSQRSGIAGVVTDQSGGVLPGVKVEASSAVLIEGSRSAISDASGRFTIADLRPGT